MAVLRIVVKRLNQGDFEIGASAGRHKLSCLLFEGKEKLFFYLLLFPKTLTNFTQQNRPLLA